jgi:hypothetical protein
VDLSVATVVEVTTEAAEADVDPNVVIMDGTWCALRARNLGARVLPAAWRDLGSYSRRQAIRRDDIRRNRRFVWAKM